MSQIAMTDDARVEAIRTLGYGEREAQFLCLAALHGGYFVRRQYAQFLERSVGGTAALLVERVLANGHARASALRNNAVIYHLCTRPFYAILGQPDNRNRREKQPLTIKNKLMGLDFVLAHREKQFLATEQEKVQYFTRLPGIKPVHLPTKVYRSPKAGARTERYFVEKYPIFVGETPTFCFVDEGLTTPSRFETFLKEYSRLLSALTRFHVVYVAARPTPFQWAGPAYERFLKRLNSGISGASFDPEVLRLLQHFIQRRQFESKDLTAFDRTRLIQFRDEKAEFSGAENDALFERWKLEGDAAILKALAPDKPTTLPAVGTFSTYELRHNYDMFGTLTTF